LNFYDWPRWAAIIYTYEYGHSKAEYQYYFVKLTALPARILGTPEFCRFLPDCLLALPVALATSSTV
jgi:hypothetical protein